MKRTAEMIAHWQSIGFCHGSLNTDNMSILGLSIDFAAFRFMDDYNPDLICNHDDDQGRYIFKDQPQIGMWEPL